MIRLLVAAILLFGLYQFWLLMSRVGTAAQRALDALEKIQLEIIKKEAGDERDKTNARYQG